MHVRMSNMTKLTRRIWLPAIMFLFLAPFFTEAAMVGEKVEFLVEQDYDLSQREKITAVLKRIGERAYFYVDEQWWQSIESVSQERVSEALHLLDGELHTRIYPVLTSIFGSEWRPGIDHDVRFTVLIHPMRKQARGYFKSADEYPKLQAANSNEREMIYLNANYITDSLAPSYLAHEFQHLITFNQKEKKYGVSDDVWLQEAFSEIAITLIGYDDPYEGSNLERRREAFLESPSDSLTEWQGEGADYGVLNLFTQYLVEHYGIDLLVQALHSRETGIASLEAVLAEKGFTKDFAQIFQDWQIAVLINDCSLNEAYCYRDQNLADLHITPSLNFLPFVSKTSLRVEDSLKDWSALFYKLVGGRGDLTLEFDGLDEAAFRVSFWACRLSGECRLETLSLDEEQRGEIKLSDFGSDYSFLTLFLFTQEKRANFGDSELAHPFFFEALMNDDQALIQRLLNQITLLKAEIAKVQAQIAALLADREGGGSPLSCGRFDSNLSFGMRDDEAVRCLQEFLRQQGKDIYPQGLVTGNFLSLTREAVIRFQEKYASEILAPLALEKGTGFVGPATRAKINQLLETK